MNPVHEEGFYDDIIGKVNGVGEADQEYRILNKVPCFFKYNPVEHGKTEKYNYKGIKDYKVGIEFIDGRYNEVFN